MIPWILSWLVCYQVCSWDQIGLKIAQLLKCCPGTVPPQSSIFQKAVTASKELQGSFILWAGHKWSVYYSLMVFSRSRGCGGEEGWERPSSSSHTTQNHRGGQDMKRGRLSTTDTHESSSRAPAAGLVASMAPLFRQVTGQAGIIGDLEAPPELDKHFKSEVNLGVMEEVPCY